MTDRPSVGDRVADTEKFRDKLSTAEAAIIDDVLFFVFEDGSQISLTRFECKVLLAHSLGIEVDWAATF